MSLLRIFLWLFCFISVCSIARAGADSAAISGTVRDAEGNTLPNVTVSLSGGPTLHVSSDASGHFDFTRLAPGEYTLSAILTGYAASGPQSIHLQSNPVSIDIVLSRVPAAPLEFQSSAIHGLIDPGGYSTSIANASSGVLRGIAVLKRTEDSFAKSAKDWPCSLQAQVRQAVVLHPDQPETLLNLGKFYVAHDQPSLAIPPLQHALALDPASEPTARALGTAWLEAGNFGKAQEVFSRALALHETSDLYELVARADEGSGLFQEAAERYRKAAALSASEESSFGIGYELLLSGALMESSTAFAEGIIRYPKSILMQIGAGTDNFLQGDTGAALSSFLAAAEIDPSDRRPYSFMTALSAVSSEQQERILGATKRYVDINPTSASANYLYAVALSRAEPPTTATRIEDLLKRAIQFDSTLAKAHLELADSYARRDDFADAVPEYEATLRLAPDPEPRYRLALAYKRLGRPADSAREMQSFRQSRETDLHSSAVPSIDLAQFISAIDTAGLRSSSQPGCPANPQ